MNLFAISAVAVLTSIAGTSTYANANLTQAALTPSLWGCDWENAAREESSRSYISFASDGEYKIFMREDGISNRTPWYIPVNVVTGNYALQGDKLELRPRNHSDEAFVNNPAHPSSENVQLFVSTIRITKYSDNFMSGSYDGMSLSCSRPL